MLSQSRHPLVACSVGLYWGLGHTLTIFLVGFPLLLLKIKLPPLVEAGFEGLVGIVLVALGLSTLIKWRGTILHFHPHRHGDQEHEHLHLHRPEERITYEEASEGGAQHWSRPHIHCHWATGWRPFLVGMVHGLAGSGAVAVLILTTFQTLGSAFYFLILFGVGSLMGMGVTALLIALPLTLAARQAKVLEHAFAVLTGLLSVGLGFYIFGQAIHIL